MVLMFINSVEFFIAAFVVAMVIVGVLIFLQLAFLVALFFARRDAAFQFR